MRSQPEKIDTENCGIVGRWITIKKVGCLRQVVARGGSAVLYILTRYSGVTTGVNYYSTESVY